MNLLDSFCPALENSATPNIALFQSQIHRMHSIDICIKLSLLIYEYLCLFLSNYWHVLWILSSRLFKSYCDLHCCSLPFGFFVCLQWTWMIDRITCNFLDIVTLWSHAGMLDHVNVMSNGVQTPLAHVAAVSVSNLETLTVMPYDPSVSVSHYFRNWCIYKP